MPQAVDVGGLVTGLIVLAGSNAVHQVVGRPLGPVGRDAPVGKVGGNWLHALGQVLHRAPQAAHVPAQAQQLAGQTPAHIPTTHDQSRNA